MDVFDLASGCNNSGNESGWTSYLDQSFVSANPSGNGFKDRSGNKEDIVVEEEEDLSMVSDASSGPPLFNEGNDDENDDNQYKHFVAQIAALDKNDAKRHSNKEHQEQPSFLDDTATSSPFIKFSKGGPALHGSQLHLETSYKLTNGFKESNQWS